MFRQLPKRKEKGHETESEAMDRVHAVILHGV